MAKFVFSMQNILHIKMQMENQAKMEYASALDALREKEDILRSLEERKEAYYMQGRQMRQTTLRMSQLRENTDSLKKMEDLIAAQKERILDAEDEVEDARVRLQDAMQERKTIEILRENAFERFLQEEREKENREVDELVSYRYGMRIKENTNGGYFRSEGGETTS